MPSLSVENGLKVSLVRAIRRLCGSQDPKSRRLVWVLCGKGGENELIGDLEAKETSASGERKTTAQDGLCFTAGQATELQVPLGMYV